MSMLKGRVMSLSDYNRVEKAMAYMSQQLVRQPTLEEVAAHVHLSPFHFQRVFCRWAGTTPKRFLQALTVERSKRMLQTGQSLIEVSLDVGLSGSSRLHDHFVTLEAVSPGEFKNFGQGISITYGVHQTPLGALFVALTQRGVCRMEFLDYKTVDEVLEKLRRDWPRAVVTRNDESTGYVIDAFFGEQSAAQRGPLSLHVPGTNFQVAVWRALLRIPAGRLASYSQLAAALGLPKASRPVGNAVGANPVALLIPCHRVIQQSGALGGYRWGAAKKQMVQTWEYLHHEAAS